MADFINVAVSPMGFFDFLFGSKDKTVPVYDKQQNQFLNFIMQMAQQGPQSNPAFQGGQNWLQNLFSDDPQAIQAMEAPYRNMWEGEIAPGIAERFAGMGSGNLNSSGFRNALANSGKDLSSLFQANRANTQLQGLGQALNYANAPFNAASQLGSIALGRPNQAIQQGSTGFLPPILGALTQGFSQGAGGGLADILLKAFGGGAKKSQASTGLGG